MTAFRYKAVRASGEVVEGDMDAPDREALIARLTDAGSMPIRIEPARRESLTGLLSLEIGGGGRASARDIMIATREIATLLRAGVELERALSIIVELAESRAIRLLFAAVLEEVRGGATLADALDRHRRQFPPSYVSMVRAGEAGGALEVVFARLAEFLERANASRAALRSALIYPVILLFTALIAVVVVVTVVLPQFEPLFAGAGKELPLLTRVMLATSHVVEDYWLAGVLFLLAVFAGFRLWVRTPGGRLAWHRYLLAVPLLGTLLIRLDVARLARTLGTLLQNGVPTIAALDIVRATLGNQTLANSLGEVTEKVKSGGALSDALAALPRFPPLAAHLARIGEETGQLEDMLIQVGEIFEQESQRTIQRLLALLLPGTTALLGLFIAAIIASVFLAIVNVNQLVF